MNWGAFFKGSFFSLFLFLISLSTLTLFGQIRQENEIIAANSKVETPVYIAEAPIAHFPQVLAASTQNVNVLLLGLDGRVGDPHPRCDAIHMFSFKPGEGKIIITSVPRGSYASNGNIITNNCSLFGFETAIKEIEKITGIKPDYVVKVGFSQVQGLLRLAGLPASPTLQLLRDRKSYAIGDNQRSYNQALFFKDSIVRYTSWIADLPWVVQKLGYEMVDTDMSFERAQEIYKQVLASKIFENPDNIILQTRPETNLVRKEIHVQDLVPQTQDWQTDPEFKAYQNDIVGYLNKIISSKNLPKIKLALEKRLWLQIEDEKSRAYWENRLQTP